MRSTSPNLPSYPIGETQASPLSRRETEVADLIARGKTNKEIAAALGIGVETAGTHCKNICRKNGLHCARELASFAAKRQRGQVLTQGG